jgi:four helix bundle protein
MTHDHHARLDHENLDVYRCSLEFLHLSLRLVRELPERGEAELRSQLKRAAMSIPLNIAEGAGKPTSADRARYHAIARGSAMECAALIDVCAVADYLAEDDARSAKQLLLRIVSMLTKMCR